ncbi:hypothetical protein CXG81DRAFT_19055 [Caulochytrium protostelioides]|uniref:RGS domain-containing protein n=1 Tax=Caulochytrium protostelioides TaxID=1555241 RepID=A0A4V1IUM7_9FUNG|nr:hypothetical protein CXG81DRAFT_19055 [Caulochytrium protostelioides]|eukprot:RKP01099.1 hypothetical protein CXG81DRAFT_19055 [Caulochytrium protostelioides]
MAAPPAADGVAVAAAAAAAAHDTPASLAAEASKLGPIDTTGYRRGDGPASAPPAAGSTSPDAPTSSDATLAMGSAGGLAPALRGATSTTFTRRSTPNLDEEDEEGAAVGALASSLAGGSGSGGGSLLAGSTAPLNSVSRTGTIGDLRRSSNAQSDPLLSGGGGGGGGGGHAAVAQQIHSAAREVIMAWGPRTRGFPFNATTRRRFEQYARVTAAIVTDGEIKIKTRTRLFESFPLSFLASDLCTWLMRKCRFIEPVEAVRYAEKLLRYGFILRYDGAMHVAADSTFLTVQASSLWPMESDVPGDLDQYLYLESRIANSPDLQGIERWEIERLTALHELLLRMDITDLEYYKALRRSRLSKFGSAPLKLFLAQERAYWQLARPAPNTDTLITNDLENAQTDAGTADKVRLDSDAYAETLSGDALLAWHEARVRQLQLGEKIPMVKMSFLLDRIMHYTDAVSPVDAFLPWNTQIANPWHLDESHKPPVRSELTVTLAELGLWKSGFAHLMTDPVGVAHFETWCCQVYAEENIRFIRRCQALDTLDRAAYVAEAHAIYTDFLQTGCAHELNLEGPILQAIEAHYPVGADGVVAVQPKIPDTLYNDAVESIMTLCSKDAYHRYLTSDHFTSFEHAVEERHQRQMAAQRHHSHHSLLSTSEKLDRLKYSPSHYNSTGNMLRRIRRTRPPAA